MVGWCSFVLFVMLTWILLQPRDVVDGHLERVLWFTVTGSYSGILLYTNQSKGTVPAAFVKVKDRESNGEHMLGFTS